MKAVSNSGGLARSVTALLGIAVSLSAVGCQVDIGGQTLPSPYWTGDDVQYFPAGPEFKLSREAAAMKAAEQDQIQGAVRAENVAPPIPLPPVADLPPVP